MAEDDGISEEDISKELQKCEQKLFDVIMNTIIFLNINGIPTETIKQMIFMKVEGSFATYKEENVRERYINDMRMTQGEK